MNKQGEIMNDQADILRRVYSEPTTQECEELITYFQKIGGRTLSSSCIRQNVFKISWTKKDNLLRNRCHVQAAAEYLEFLKSTFSVNDKADDIKVLIADIIPYIKQIDLDQDTSFILLSTNTLPSTIHFKHVKELFYKNSLPKDAHRRYDLDILVIYGLRLSLEKRILGFLGIDFIEKSNGGPLLFSNLIPIIKSLTKINFKTGINFDEIKWVLDWLNHHMHRHLRPYPWAIHQAFEVLNPLLLASKINVGDTEHFSFYASTSTQDIDILKKEIESLVQKDNPGAKICWETSRELFVAKDSIEK